MALSGADSNPAPSGAAMFLIFSKVCFKYAFFFQDRNLWALPDEWFGGQANNYILRTLRAQQ